MAFELYATGEYSLERLSDELTNRGLRTSPGRYPAGPVSESKLGTMLRDRYYLAWAHEGSRLGVLTYKRVVYPGRHKALVSQEVFDRVQAILDASGLAGERRRTHDHYLKGRLWCGRCHEQGRRGRLIITKATGRRGVDYFYFLYRGRQDGLCDLPYLPMEHVEDAALESERQVRGGFTDADPRRSQEILHLPHVIAAVGGDDRPSSRAKDPTEFRESGKLVGHVKKHMIGHDNVGDAGGIGQTPRVGADHRCSNPAGQRPWQSPAHRHGQIAQVKPDRPRQTVGVVSPQHPRPSSDLDDRFIVVQTDLVVQPSGPRMVRPREARVERDPSFQVRRRGAVLLDREGRDRISGHTTR